MAFYTKATMMPSEESLLSPVLALGDPSFPLVLVPRGSHNAARAIKHVKSASKCTGLDILDTIPREQPKELGYMGALFIITCVVFMIFFRTARNKRRIVKTAGRSDKPKLEISFGAAMFSAQFICILILVFQIGMTKSHCQVSPDLSWIRPSVFYFLAVLMVFFLSLASFTTIIVIYLNFERYQQGPVAEDSSETERECEGTELRSFVRIE